MHTATNTLIHATFEASEAGRIHFGQLVGQLIEAGVESYDVDYRAHRATCHRTDDGTVTVELGMPDLPIAQGFVGDGVRAAIRGAQRGEVMYPAFKRLTMQAGCVGYSVWIAGRHVVYHGRRGETHIERFPD